MKKQKQTKTDKLRESLYDQFAEWCKDKANLPSPQEMIAGIKKELGELGLSASVLAKFPKFNEEDESPDEAKNRLLVYWDLTQMQGRYHGKDFYLDVEGKYWPGLMLAVTRTLENIKKLRKARAEREAARVEQHLEADSLTEEQQLELVEKDHTGDYRNLFEDGKISKSSLVASAQRVATAVNTFGEKIPPASVKRGKGASAAGIQ